MILKTLTTKSTKSRYDRVKVGDASKAEFDGRNKVGDSKVGNAKVDSNKFEKDKIAKRKIIKNLEERLSLKKRSVFQPFLLLGRS